MHVLFFTYDTIIPSDSGGKARAYNLIKNAKKDSRVSLFSFMREGYDLANLEKIRELGIDRVEVFPRSKKSSFKSLRGLFLGKESVFKSLYYDKKIAKILFEYVQKEKVDLIHFESFYTGFYLDQGLRDLGVRQVYGSENIEYLLYKDSLKSLNPVYKKIAASQVKKIENEEIEMARNSDAMLAVTEKERKYFASFSDNTFVVPNGVDSKDFPFIARKKKDKLSLLFIGNFKYFPNLDGLKFFIKEVWPRLNKENFSLTLLGREVNSLDFINDDSVKKIDYAAKLDEVYNNADIFISPLRFGGGTNFKVLEAMSTGLPVVALRDRAEGLNAKNDQELLIASGADDFVKSIEKLSQDADFRERIGKNASKFVKENYSWKEIGENLYNIWYDLVDEKS